MRSEVQSVGTNRVHHVWRDEQGTITGIDTRVATREVGAVETQNERSRYPLRFGIAYQWVVVIDRGEAAIGTEEPVPVSGSSEQVGAVILGAAHDDRGIGGGRNSRVVLRNRESGVATHPIDAPIGGNEDSAIGAGIQDVRVLRIDGDGVPINVNFPAHRAERRSPIAGFECTNARDVDGVRAARIDRYRKVVLRLGSKSAHVQSGSNGLSPGSGDVIPNEKSSKGGSIAAHQCEHEIRRRWRHGQLDSSDVGGRNVW